MMQLKNNVYIKGEIEIEIHVKFTVGKNHNGAKCSSKEACNQLNLLY